MLPTRAPPGRGGSRIQSKTSGEGSRELRPAHPSSQTSLLTHPRPQPRARARGAACASGPRSLRAAPGALGGQGEIEWGAGHQRRPLWREGSRPPGRALSGRRFRFNPRPEHPDSLTAVSAARWGLGAPDLVTVGLPNPAAFYAWLCYLGFVIRAPVLLLDVRKVTQPLVFLSSPRTLSFSCRRRHKLGYT